MVRGEESDFQIHGSSVDLTLTVVVVRKQHFTLSCLPASSSNQREQSCFQKGREVNCVIYLQTDVEEQMCVRDEHSYESVSGTYRELKGELRKN